MRYYTYRLGFDFYVARTNIDEIPVKLTNNPLEEGDKVIIIVSQSMMVLGAYVYHAQTNSLVLEMKIGKNVKEFYEALPMIEFVNEQTYKMFSKRVREIEQEDHAVFVREEEE